MPQLLFEKLNLIRWFEPRLDTPQGSSVTGEAIRFIESRALVIIPRTGDQHRVIVQTFVGNTRFLIGRAFLRRFKVLLDGPGAQTCLMD